MGNRKLRDDDWEDQFQGVVFAFSGDRKRRTLKETIQIN